ncbi:MAG TPA: cell division protein FtsL [Terracidiphilus sp.]|jgi:cell division protein FtsL|nr:cell division protein FtsL [Terracidiphilus sp.]
MAACTTTFDLAPAQSWPVHVANHNAELMAQQASRRRGVRTPEVMFTRHFDNTRLVKASDPVRVRQMRVFAATATVLFSLIMIYGLQHFSAIEGSYRVESEKQQLDQLREDNRQLRLTEAQLSQPSRIDGLARQMGMASPDPSQVVHSTAQPETSAPVYAQFTAPPPLK